MNPEIKSAWVAALRSGEYEQGTSGLRSRNDEFCCLGVLSDLAAQAGFGNWCIYQETCGGAYAFSDHNAERLGAKMSCSLLTHGVSTWAELDNAVGLDGVRVVDKLMFLNDRRTSFPEIAQFIEDNL